MQDNYIIIVVFRNQDRDEITFIKKLIDLLENDYHINRKHIIIGDWNINIDNENKITRKLEESMAVSGYIQTIKDSTRITKNSRTRIDLCYTNMITESITSGVLSTEVTDHLPILIGIEKNSKSQKINTENDKKKTRINYDYKRIKQEMDNSDWKQVKEEESPSVAMKRLQRQIQSIMERNISEPRNNNHYNKKKEKWMTKELLKKIRKRDRLMNKANKEKDQKRRYDMMDKIKMKNKEIKISIKQEKNKYYIKRISETNKDMKKHWEVLNEIMSGDSYKIHDKTEIEEIEVEGRTITDPKQCARK